MTDIFGPASAANAVTNRPADTRAFGALDTFFKDCSSAGADDGTDVEAAWLNEMLVNLRGVARANGQLASGSGPVVPEDNSDNMLVAAILHLMQRGRFGRAVDTGAVNAIVVALNPVPPELIDGMVISVKARFTNTGATTLQTAGQTLHVKNRAGAELSGGEINVGLWQDYKLDLANNVWVVSAPTSASRLWHTGTGMAGTVASGAVAAMTTTLTDPVTASSSAPIYMLVPMNGVTMAPNATLDFGAGAKQVVSNQTGLSIQGGEVDPQADAFFAWDGGSKVRLMNGLGASPLSTASFTLSSTQALANPNVSYKVNLTGSAAPFATIAAGVVTITKPGIYLVVLSGAMNLGTSGAAVGTISLNMSISASDPQLSANGSSNIYSYFAQSNLTAVDGQYIAAGTTITAQAQGGAGVAVSYINVINATLKITRLG